MYTVLHGGHEEYSFITHHMKQWNGNKLKSHLLPFSEVVKPQSEHTNWVCVEAVPLILESAWGYLPIAKKELLFLCNPYFSYTFH